jgi:WD40 repeat protein
MVRGEVKVWDAQNGQAVLSLKALQPLCVVFSPDGKRLASANRSSGLPMDPGELKVWDAQTGQELLTLKGHTAPVSSVAYSPDGKRLASASGWGDTATVKVWDARTGRELLSLKGGGYQVIFSPDGNRLASLTGDALTIWDATPLAVTTREAKN